MIHVGIDLHFDNMFNSAVNDNGEQISKGRFSADEKGLQEWFARFDEPVRAVVECTGFWYWVADWCQANEIPLILAHAKMTKAISYAKVKTDKVDAHTLAELLRADLIPQAHMQMGAQRDLRKRSGKKVAQAVVAKELAKIAWHVLSKQQDYKGFKGQPTRVASRPYWPQPISLRFGQER